ncbi:MAG: bifunctional proline dehydrogenase/L-glutamate gamma-semialdehyde dehydrogenase [Bacteroidales bacterium]|nr:bifunctional proline dehydrogenase/L-glutamate gamma-semialdehyde dehydrogenase [Bacteroidales bacterium]
MKEVTTNDVREWAKKFLVISEKELTFDELKEQKKYAVLVQHPNDKVLLSKMLDESSQIRSNRKLSRRVKLLIERYGVPEFFPKSDAFLLKLFTWIGYRFPAIAMPIFKKRLRMDTKKIIIKEERPALDKHLDSRRKEQIGQNVNLLGEVVLGNAEADHRYYHYLEALKDPRINYISIKISGIYAQLHPLNHAQSKEELCRRIAAIYQQAIDYPYTDEQGISRPKFVNLDMEEYKDTELTLEVFLTVMGMPQFKNYTSGIVIQAYLPDAWLLQTALLDFARQRIAEGGAPIKMRLVKGANLSMETIISSLRGWENPVFPTKVEVDANYLLILDRALLPENAAAVHVGVASHNFFTIGYAYLLSQENGVEKYVDFEMLEGMANHLPRVMKSLGKQVILYTPVVKDEHFLNAVSYLVRRLDENTGKDNFLSYAFNLKVDSEHWKFLYDQFLQAYALKDTIKPEPTRKQNRNLPPLPVTETDTFHNEPDTDFDLHNNRNWADSIRHKWKKSKEDTPYVIPVQVGGKEIFVGKKRPYMDRSQDDEVCVCEVHLSDLEQMKNIVDIADTDAPGWRKTTLEERNKLLNRVADHLCAARGDLIGCMSAITGKTFTEGDVEVSEAVDFCRFYPISMKHFDGLETIRCTPKGVILVIPPWNFPLAIPVGGVASALACGNSVILKPATVAFPIAWEFAKCFWAAGVPKETLQVVCCDGRDPLNYLTAHPVIKHVILTGGTDTAFRLLANNPRCPLSAETGGKNAIILTGSGDRDHAILNVVASAFGNSGQKCSACSLLLVEKEIYNDPEFASKLKDAVTSMQTGSVWEPNHIIGPMVDNHNEKLLHAIEHLEPGESWLVAPEFMDNKKYILKPCVKWGVRPESYTFRTELFGPLLAVVCIDNLQQGIEYVNATGYGLTSGLQTLDETERELWRNSIEAGNLYINRGITGAIVNRQPFGGMKLSAFGGGIKAGGPNYVSCFLDIEENQLPEAGKPDTEFAAFAALLDGPDKTRFESAVSSYRRNLELEFSQERDVNHIIGEENMFRYLPLKNCVLRIKTSDRLCDSLMIVTASCLAQTPITISVADDDPKYGVLQQLAGKNDRLSVVTEDEASFIGHMVKYERIRTCNPYLSDAIYKKAAELGKYIATAPPLAEGRVEMLHYMKEQSITFEYHRYGSITE